MAEAVEMTWRQATDWDKVIAINYVGPVRMIHRFLPPIIQRNAGGRIITVSSDAGRVGSMGETFYSGSKNPKLREALIKAIPMRRLAKAVEIAHAILFFASPAAGFMTGQTVSVSGGLTMHG